jgi:hypothetical protein
MNSYNWTHTQTLRTMVNVLIAQFNIPVVLIALTMASPLKPCSTDDDDDDDDDDGSFSFKMVRKLNTDLLSKSFTLRLRSKESSILGLLFKKEAETTKF